jgi:DNA ligase 1
MQVLLEKLMTTNSTKEKAEILRTSDVTENEKDALISCYDPSILFYVSKIPEPESIGDMDFDQAFLKFKNLTASLTSRDVTGNRARTYVKVFLESCNEEAQKIFTMILEKDLRLGMSASTLNKVWPDCIAKFKVQLAKTYDPEKKYDTEHWYASPKLDGIRCMFINGKMHTRAGKDVVGFENIEAQLQDAAERFDLDFIDGELYSDEIPFQDIQGIVVRNKNIVPEDKLKIWFNVFAVGNDSIKDTPWMLEKLDLIAFHGYSHLKPLSYSWIKNDPDLINERCQEFMDQGYEGIMLRHPTNWYEWKRGQGLLKHKLFLEDDFEVTGFEEGTGKFVGSLGALHIRGKTDGKKIIARVGSGYDDAERKEIWAMGHDVVGMTIEVKFQGITDYPDKNIDVADIYSIRFPVFNKFKEDR